MLQTVPELADLSDISEELSVFKIAGVLRYGFN
jgi:hypothetical protein